MPRFLASFRNSLKKASLFIINFPIFIYPIKKIG